MMGPNFPPSRGRVVTALAATAVGGTHPAGRPLPSLIVGAPSSPAGHARATRAAAPLASLVNLALPMRLKTLLSSLAADPAGTVGRRARALETFRYVDAVPPRRRDGWPRRLGTDSAARNVNLPLLHLLARRFGYVDQNIVGD